MSWTRRAATVVMALAGAFCLVLGGCGGDDEYACDAGCADLADRWDDCALDFSVMPDRVGSESSARSTCQLKLGEQLEDAAAEAAKLEICERISADIYGSYCSVLQERGTPELPKTAWVDWLEAMKAVF